MPILLKVTALMMENFSRGKAAVHVFASRCGARVTVVDVGSRSESLPDGVMDRKVRQGTADLGSRSRHEQGRGS